MRFHHSRDFYLPGQTENNAVFAQWMRRLLFHRDWRHGKGILERLAHECLSDFQTEQNETQSRQYPRSMHGHAAILHGHQPPAYPRLASYGIIFVLRIHCWKQLVGAFGSGWHFWRNKTEQSSTAGDFHSHEEPTLQGRCDRAGQLSSSQEGTFNGSVTQNRLEFGRRINCSHPPIHRYRRRVELCINWLKCILGCRHFQAESSTGVGAIPVTSPCESVWSDLRTHLRNLDPFQAAPYIHCSPIPANNPKSSSFWVEKGAS